MMNMNYQVFESDQNLGFFYPNLDYLQGGLNGLGGSWIMIHDKTLLNFEKTAFDDNFQFYENKTLRLFTQHLITW